MLLGTAAADGSSPAAARIRVYDEISARLTDHAADSPTLLVFEDAHWSDESSLELLAYLAERCAAHPLMIIITLRPAARPESPLGGLVARLARPTEAHRITLSGLAAGEMEQFLIQRLGRELDPRVVAATVARSDGNPFFALELARLAAAGGDAGVGVPDSLRDVLLRRVAMLPAGAQTILSAASVAGRQSTLAQLSAMTGMSDDELDTAVTDATEAGLMTDLWRPRPGVRFTHALVREALYEKLRPRPAPAGTLRLRAGCRRRTTTPTSMRSPIICSRACTWSVCPQSSRSSCRRPDGPTGGSRTSMPSACWSRRYR